MYVNLQNVMWGGTQNVAGQFLDSSSGGSSATQCCTYCAHKHDAALCPCTGFTFDQATSKVLTVQTNVLTSGATCDFAGYADAANIAAGVQGYVADDYDFRLYLLPQQLPCGWGG